MNDSAPKRDESGGGRDSAHHLAETLVSLGEGRAAVDMMRRQVNVARSSPSESSTLLRLLSAYAGILESTDALAEAEFIRAEALEVVGAAHVPPRDAVDAFLDYGLLLCKMHNYDGAVARLQEAIRRADELDDVEPLRKQIMLAQAWRGKAQAFEALGEFSQASEALDVLMNIKRHIRFIVFAPTRG